MIFASNLFAATYYVDYSTGSDGNNGTSKTTPWQHAPGMQTCTSLCKSTTIKAGDSIILKGGVTWPNASFQWSLPGGAVGNPVYVGVDKTWYTGSSWTRPILTAGGTLITNNNDTMFWVPGYVTVDNFEITGFYWNSSCVGLSYGSCSVFEAGQYSGQTWENLYVHGWTHAGTDGSTSSGATSIVALGGTGSTVAHDNVIDGSDVPGDHSATAFFNGPSIAYNNYIRQVASGFISTGSTSIHDNYITDVGPAYCNMPVTKYAGNCTHENGFEDNADSGLNFYNNVISNVSVGLAVWIAPYPGYTATMWNNVIYAIHDNQVFGVAPPVYSSTYCAGKTSNGYCSAAGSYVIYNNTIECGDDTTQYDVCQSGVGVVGSGSIAASVVYQNNHFISASTASGCATGTGAATSCTFGSSNVIQTLATAMKQGYNSSQTYAFSPTSSSDATVKVGSNLALYASGNLASLGSDTTYACTDGSGSQTSCSARTSVSRPVASGGSWDAGAYSFMQPSAPLSLTGDVTTLPQ
jgi:hypothetical protein